MIWVIFIFSLALADKLDRTYLPPPGSKFSGGGPGVIQVPLEYPKLQYFPVKDENIQIPEIAIGIDRIAPKRPADANLPIDNPSKHTDNAFISRTTINYPLNTAVSYKNEYSTTTPVNYSPNFFENIQNPDYSKNLYQINHQLQHTTDSNENQIQTTENYPLVFQNIPVSDVSRKDFTNGLPFNRSESQDDVYSIVNRHFNSSPSPQLVPDLINHQYGPGEYSSSSIPTIQAETNSISSTVSPSTANNDFNSNIGPNQFYSSTLKPSQYSTTNPIGSKISPVLNYFNIKKRPERIQAQADREASILNYESNITPEGYAYSYDTSNGIHADETGVTLNGVKAKGSYSYIGDDGKLYNVVYTADEYGFQPRGDHLPTSPPIPDAILKVIEQVSKEKEAGIFDDGSYDENKYGYKKYHNGFYSPKSDFPKVNPIVHGDEILKNTKITPMYSAMPVIKENRGSQFSLQPHQFNNQPGIKHVGSHDTTNLKTENDTNTKLTPGDLFKQTYKNPIIESGRTDVDNYKLFDGGLNEKNKVNELNDETFSKETGYQYNPPEHTEKNNFVSRFSGLPYYETPKHGSNNKVTPKPFQTPYAMQTNDERKDNYGEPLQHSEDEYYEEQLFKNNNKYPLHSESHFSGKDKYNITQLNNIKFNNDPYRKVYKSQETEVSDYGPQIVNKGYTYQQEIIDSDKKPQDSFVAHPHSYTSSTILPTDLTSHTTIEQSGEPKFNVGIPETSTDYKYTTHTPNVYKTNIQLNKTYNLPDLAVTPEFINQNGINVPSETNIGYPKTDLKDTNLRTEFSTNVPIIGNSYAPNLDVTYSDEYNLDPTEKIIGEDFSGPKQPQRFDPRTGYYY